MKKEVICNCVINHHPSLDARVEPRRFSARVVDRKLNNHERGLGVFTRLPLELRQRIYQLCIPPECSDDETAAEISNVARKSFRSLPILQASRAIFNEMRPSIDRETRSRRFNLALGPKGVRFENLEEDATARGAAMRFIENSAVPQPRPLRVFADTLPRIRRLNLHLEIDSSRYPQSGNQVVLSAYVRFVVTKLSEEGCLRRLQISIDLGEGLRSDLNLTSPFENVMWSSKPEYFLYLIRGLTNLTSAACFSALGGRISGGHLHEILFIVKGLENFNSSDSEMADTMSPTPDYIEHASRRYAEKLWSALYKHSGIRREDWQVVEQGSFVEGPWSCLWKRM